MQAEDRFKDVTFVLPHKLTQDRSQYKTDLLKSHGIQRRSDQDTECKGMQTHSIASSKIHFVAPNPNNPSCFHCFIAPNPNNTTQWGRKAFLQKYGYCSFQH